MELYTTRASYYRRQADTMLEQSGDVDANVVDAVCQVLIQGIDKVNAAQKFGDDHVRLEKYLTRVVRHHVLSQWLSPTDAGSFCTVRAIRQV